MAEELEAVPERDGAIPESTVAQAVPEVEAGRTEDQPDPDAPGTVETLGEEEQEQEGKKREGGYKRKLRRAEQEAAYLRGQLARKEAGSKSAVEPPADDPKPRYDENLPLEDNLEARDAWLRRQLVRETLETVEKQAKTKAEQSEHESAQKQFFAREEAVSDLHEDYEDVVEPAARAISGSRTATGANLEHALIVGEKGPELLYHLGQHPEEIQRLLQLPPVQALVELGKLEARIAQDSSAPAKEPESRITKAEPPPTPVRKSSRVDNAELRDDLPPEEWGRRFRKKMEKN